MPKAFSSVLISVVVARKEDKFCVTDERWGWYLPAGRVDFGECFTTAGVRESMEEAGLDAALDGIYRFEFSVDSGFVRFRVIFAAHQVDETKSLKTEADDETYGAEWMTLKEVIALSKGKKSILSKLNAIPRIRALKDKGERPAEEKIRGSEIIHMFNWAEKGTKVFNSRLYYGQDGNEIDNKIVEVSTEYKIVLIIKNIKEENQYYVHPHYVSKLADFTTIAQEQCTKLYNRNVKFISSFEVKNFCGIYHIAPKTKKHRARMTLCYYAEADVQDKVGCRLKFKNSEMFLTAKAGAQPDVQFAMNNVVDSILAPLEILAWEGSEHKILK